MRFVGYTKKYDTTIFENFDLEFVDASITVILGNSGIGKTTLLNALASLDDKYEGKVATDECAYVFQEPRLLKGATVRKNIELACRDKSIVDEFIEKVELSDHANKFPKELSGGMQERVSLARAFASQRKILLMDEPFASLDIGLKYRLYEVFRNLWNTYRPTTVIITHDLDEALELGDRIVLLKDTPAKIALDVNLKEYDKIELKEKIKSLLVE